MNRENTPKSIRKSLNLLLPHHIIEEEILPRLPVKPLFRFRCVSKSWSSLIDSRPFIKTHLQNASRNTAFPYHRLIINRRDGDDGDGDGDGDGSRVEECSLQSKLDGSIHPTPIDVPNIDQFANLQIVGCLNGLVCFLEIYDRSFVFWNPSTRNLKRLPQLHDGYILSSGFGWDESSDDYKVFAIVFMLSAEEILGKVYSSKTNSWKTVELMHLVVELVYSHSFDKRGMFVGGKLHWHSDANRNIVCFGLKTQVWKKVEQPYESGSGFCSVVGVIGGCLSWVKLYSNTPLDDAEAEVWVMKEYGVKESWTKVVALSHLQELVQHPLLPTFGDRHGEVLLFFGRFFLVYFPRHNNEFWRLRRFNESVSEEDICVESLVWHQVA